MCVIIDANMMGRFLNLDDPDMQPVRDWMESDFGRLAYSEFSKILKEFGTHEQMRRKIKEYSDRGKLKSISPKKIEVEVKRLQSLGLISDDEHIIALARVAKVKLLVTNDEKLEQDFKNHGIGRGKNKPRIYKYESHKHHLRRDTCL